MMRKTLLLMFLTASLYGAGSVSSSSVTDNDLKNGFELALQEYPYGDFWEGFYISPSEWYSCATSDPKKGLFGMKATMIEPLYLVDVTNKNNEVKSLGLKLGTFRPDKSGLLNNDGGTYVNIFKIPLFHMLLKNTTNGLFAFEKGNAKLVYLGMIDPKKWNDILAFSLIPERGLFETVSGALAGAASCLANSTYDMLDEKDKFNTTVGKELRAIIDAAYFSAGCIGNIPTGTISTHENPLMTAKLVTASVLSDMHSHKGAVASLEVKHRVRSVLNGYQKDILCRGEGKNLIVPLSQYSMVVIYPTTGQSKEIGISPMEYAFRNRGSGNTVMLMINQKKEYVAFAYQD